MDFFSSKVDSFAPIIIGCFHEIVVLKRSADGLKKKHYSTNYEVGKQIAEK